MREANARGERLGLSEDELAFYDALETNDSAVQVLGDETLRDIARQLVETVRNNITIDWTLRENVRANLRRLVRRILRKHGYPPDKQEKATQTVLDRRKSCQKAGRWPSEESPTRRRYHIQLSCNSQLQPHLKDGSVYRQNRPTGEDSNWRRRELSWLAAGHRVHLPGSTAASLFEAVDIVVTSVVSSLNTELIYS